MSYNQHQSQSVSAPNCTVTVIFAALYGFNTLINSSELLNCSFLALGWSCPSLHIIHIISYDLHNTLSVFQSAAHCIASENNSKGLTWLFSAAEANSQYPAAGYGEFAVILWHLQYNSFVCERRNRVRAFVCTACLSVCVHSRRTDTHIMTHELQSVEVGDW